VLASCNPGNEDIGIGAVGDFLTHVRESLANPLNLAPARVL
jgi:hypothetical protein